MHYPTELSPLKSLEEFDHIPLLIEEEPKEEDNEETEDVESIEEIDTKTIDRGIRKIRRELKYYEPLSIILNALSEIPYLTLEEERALVQNIESIRNKWRETMLESPIIQDMLFADYIEVCKENKALLRFSKLARNKQFAKPELQNSTSEVLDSMNRKRPTIKRAITRRDTLLESLSTMEPSDKRTEVEKQYTNNNMLIRMLFEQNPVKINWFVSAADEVPKHEILRNMYEETKESSPDTTTFIPAIGETIADLKHRIDHLDTMFVEWHSLKNKLIESNMALGLWGAKRFNRHKWDNPDLREDLVQEAMLGLERAVDKYNHRHNTKFSTFALEWIRQSISHAKYDMEHIVRVPKHIQEILGKIGNFCTEHTSTHNGEEPEIESIAEIFSINIHTLKSVQHIMKIKTLDSGKKARMTLLNKLPDRKIKSPIHESQILEIRSGICECLKRIHPNHRKILLYRTGLYEYIDAETGNLQEASANEEKPALTLEETGKILNVSRQRIKQAEELALISMHQVSNILLPHIKGRTPKPDVHTSHSNPTLHTYLRPFMDVRSGNTLAKHGIFTVFDALQKTEEELLLLKGCRSADVRDLFRALALLGIEKNNPVNIMAVA